MRITEKDKAMMRRYAATDPKQFGDLHEKMKYLVKLARDQELFKTHHDINVAIYDLETEVECYEPKRPPFGKRIIQL